MSTRILQDDEITQPSDIYAFVNYKYGRGQSVTLEHGGFGVSELPGFVLRECNASCRCLLETEPVKNGDVVIYGNGNETLLTAYDESRMTPSKFYSWASGNPSYPVAVVRYE